MSREIRQATLADRDAIRRVIGRSVRQLGATHYTSQQLEAALGSVFGVDTQLIEDGSYFVASAGGELLGCGGWSYRRTLFGGDAEPSRDAAKLDPARDAARIRAFFVDPAHARRGVAGALLERCEADACARGFRQLELMATLPGVAFYRSRGYLPAAPVEHELAPGLSIRFVPMRKA